MNISDAKKQVSNAIKMYLDKDEYGEYSVQTQHQRPLFLYGVPGIGKTAVMQQVASEMGIGLITYSMTHHTRQSALGLPMIVHKKYGDAEFDISEYTMSEIIASVYEYMDKTGLKEGILFLDEINCVSETLAPSMLQFLQYKMFGKHYLPDGWVIVTAGNPPEFNRSVNDFDIATLDRLKFIRITPDYTVWKKYALINGVHGSIISFLDSKPQSFFKVENTVDGKRFVTPRGWENLSNAIYMSEKLGMDVDINLVEQYLHDDAVARDFSIYYELYLKYCEKYRAEDILAGKWDDELKEKAKSAAFDERISLLGLLIEFVRNDISKSLEMHKTLLYAGEVIKNMMKLISVNNIKMFDALKNIYSEVLSEKEKKDAAGTLMRAEKRQYLYVLGMLKKWIDRTESIDSDDKKTILGLCKGDMEHEQHLLKQEINKAISELKMLFKFIETVYGDGQEMTILVTELTLSPQCAEFINKYGSNEYAKYQGTLLFEERRKSIQNQIKEVK